MLQVIGVDLGGTAIKGLVLSEGGTVLAEAGCDTDAGQGRDGILDRLRGLIRRLLVLCPAVQGIGIASAGRVNTVTGEVVYATDNLPGWQGVQLTEWSMGEFGLPAAADNDANAALLGEAWQGAGRGSGNLFMITLGTGVGGACMTHGKLVRGARWSGGEVGHSILVPGGRPCNCGKQGCVEQYVSGTALVKQAGIITGRTYGHGQELMEQARSHDLAAMEVLEQYTANLAVVVANLGVTLDPEFIIVGGGVIHDRDIWWPLLQQKLPADASRERLVPAELGNRAGCFGAAKLMLDTLRQGSDSE